MANTAQNSALVKGRRPSKFTPENIARIKDWVAQGVSREEIANRLDATVGSLQVTCSKLGISLRRSGLAKGNGAIQPLGVVRRSIEHIPQGDHAASATRCTLLIGTGDRQATIDLPLTQNAIERLALEASVRDLSIAEAIGKVLTQMIEDDLVQEVLRDGNWSRDR